MAIQQVLSPLPGTFYRRSAPTEPVFVNDGDEVLPGAVVGLIEVMKTFTEVRAESAGRIVRFLVDNEDAVMAGDPLYEIEA